MTKSAAHTDHLHSARKAVAAAIENLHKHHKSAADRGELARAALLVQTGGTAKS